MYKRNIQVLASKAIDWTDVPLECVREKCPKTDFQGLYYHLFLFPSYLREKEYII